MHQHILALLRSNPPYTVQSVRGAQGLGVTVTTLQEAVLNIIKLNTRPLSESTHRDIDIDEEEVRIPKRNGEFISLPDVDEPAPRRPEQIRRSRQATAVPMPEPPHDIFRDASVAVAPTQWNEQNDAELMSQLLDNIPESIEDVINGMAEPESTRQSGFMDRASVVAPRTQAVDAPALWNTMIAPSYGRASDAVPVYRPIQQEVGSEFDRMLEANIESIRGLLGGNNPRNMSFGDVFHALFNEVSLRLSEVNWLQAIVGVYVDAIVRERIGGISVNHLREKINSILIYVKHHIIRGYDVNAPSPIITPDVLRVVVRLNQIVMHLIRPYDSEDFIAIRNKMMHLQRMLCVMHCTAYTASLCSTAVHMVRQYNAPLPTQITTRQHGELCVLPSIREILLTGTAWVNASESIAERTLIAGVMHSVYGTNELREYTKADATSLMQCVIFMGIRRCIYPAPVVDMTASYASTHEQRRRCRSIAISLVRASDVYRNTLRQQSRHDVLSNSIDLGVRILFAPYNVAGVRYGESEQARRLGADTSEFTYSTMSEAFIDFIRTSAISL